VACDEAEVEHVHDHLGVPLRLDVSTYDPEPSGAAR
jgi:hypothetical protein